MRIRQRLILTARALCMYVSVCVCLCLCLSECVRMRVCVRVYVSVCYNREQSTLAKIQTKKKTFSITDDLIQLIVKIILYNHILKVNYLKSV